VQGAGRARLSCGNRAGEVLATAIYAVEHDQEGAA
jgi:hypothetical protein